MPYEMTQHTTQVKVPQLYPIIRLTYSRGMENETDFGSCSPVTHMVYQSDLIATWWWPDPLSLDWTVL